MFPFYVRSFVFMIIWGAGGGQEEIQEKKKQKFFVMDEVDLGNNGKVKVKVKVKQSRYRPGVAQRFTGS